MSLINEFMNLDHNCTVLSGLKAGFGNGKKALLPKLGAKAQTKHIAWRCWILFSAAERRLDDFSFFPSRTVLTN